ncbi:hypothetical protein IWZ00DRAFT_264192 [Phyllosticta capitalensis]|uniref:C2H2-type domain-containing protein n=1 Tax=Phyllosticta capitalensis TaxID=121624 RepID=A0ABR1YUS0_9PEZI
MASQDSIGTRPSKVLIKAIEYADLERLHGVIKSICEESEVANALFEEKLLVPISSGQDRKSGNAQKGGKRQRPRYAVCTNCKEEFDMTENDDEACDYHDGELEMVEDFWVDNEEETFGPNDTDENKAEYPEGFEWDCCNEQTDADGCKTGPHVEDKNHLPSEMVKRYKWDR